MGDIHGAWKALKQCLERSEFNYEADTLVQLGDIVDGYDESFECVEELLKVKNLVAIRGNHDDWFETFLQSGFHPGQWNFGGKGTIMSYLKHAGKEIVCFPSSGGYKTSLNASDIPDSHRKLFFNQSLYFIDDKYRCFVHGGFDRNIPFGNQELGRYFWDRELWLGAMNHAAEGGMVRNFEMETRFREIYIGHTPTTNWNTDKPMTALNITNLDTGAGHKGRLTIMDVDSKEYWQSDPVPSLYNENFRH